MQITKKRSPVIFSVTGVVADAVELLTLLSAQEMFSMYSIWTKILTWDVTPIQVTFFSRKATHTSKTQCVASNTTAWFLSGRVHVLNWPENKEDPGLFSS